jgi:hypothetical protein
VSKKTILISLFFLCLQSIQLDAWMPEATIALRQLMFRAAIEATDGIGARFRATQTIGCNIVGKYRKSCFKLLDEYANPNIICDYGGHSLIMAGVWNSDIDFVRSILACGGNPNLIENYSPLNEAVRMNQYGLAHLLLDHKADPNRSMGSDPFLSPLGSLLYSISTGRYMRGPGCFDPIKISLEDSLKMAKLLLDNGASPVEMQKSGKTPLKMLQEVGGCEVRNMLLDIFYEKIESDLEGRVVHE